MVTAEELSRRTFLRVGGLGGLSLALAAHQAKAGGTPDDRAVILLLLVGGPSQLDSFDPKPDAPAEIRGPFRTIATRVPGLRVCEHLPRLAQRLDRVALVRSLHHDEAPIHEAGLQLVQTGHRFGLGEEHPHLGSLAACRLGPRGEIPPFCVLPGPLGSTGVNVPRGQSAGPLGRNFDPLVLDAAHDLSAEPAAMRDAYGHDAFGRSCLRARQLVEAGAGRHREHVRDGLRHRELGLPRPGPVQYPRRLRHDRAADLRPRLSRPPERPGAAGTIGHDAGRGHGRVRPHAPAQRGRRPRSLAGRLRAPCWPGAASGAVRPSAPATRTPPRPPIGPFPPRNWWRPWPADWALIGNSPRLSRMPTRSRKLLHEDSLVLDLVG